MEKRIILRVPDELYEQVNEVVKEGKFKNVSQVVRAALQEFLDHREN